MAKKHATPRNNGRHTPYSTAKRIGSHLSTAYGVGKNLHSTFKKLRDKSKTQTKTKTKKKVSPTIQSPPEGLSKSYTVGPRGHGKLNSKKYPTSFYDYFTCATLTSNTQLQAIGNLADSGSADVITNIQQIQASVGANVGKLNESVGYSAYRIFVKEIYLETTMTNESSCVADVCLYDLIARVDGPGPPATSFNSGPASIGGSVTSTLGTWPFAVPYHYPHFLTQYTIVKRTPIELSPGRSHKHVFRHPVMKSFDYNRLSNESAVKGLHSWTMITFKGMPLSATLGQGGGTDVSLCPIKLVYSMRAVNHAALVNVIPKFEKQGTNNFIAAPATLYERGETFVHDVLVTSATSGGNSA